MMVLRCTQKLLQRLPPSVLEKHGENQTNIERISYSSTTALGDWYTTLLFTRPAHLVLAVSENSRLCVLVPAREPKLLVPRFQRAVASVLGGLGIWRQSLEREVEAMSEVRIARTSGGAQSRSAISSLVEATRMVKGEYELREWDNDETGLRELSLYISELPCGPLGMDLPYEVARGLLHRARRDTDINLGRTDRPHLTLVR